MEEYIIVHKLSVFKMITYYTRFVLMWRDNGLDSASLKARKIQYQFGLWRRLQSGAEQSNIILGA